MPSDTDIANLALTMIGHETISSFNEGGKAADLVKLHYSQCRDALLRSHPWNFTIRRASLALAAETPNHEFTYFHALPTDCLKVLRTNWEADGTSGTAIYGFPGINGYANDTVPYRLENSQVYGRVIASNEEDVSIEYVARITDPTKFDALFVECLVLSLAARVCMRLVDNAALYKSLKDELRQTLPSAMTTDAQEGTPRDIVDTSAWLTARV